MLSDRPGFYPLPGLSSQSRPRPKPEPLQEENGESNIESILQEEIIQDFANEQELMRKYFAGKLVFSLDVYSPERCLHAESNYQL